MLNRVTFRHCLQMPARPAIPVAQPVSDLTLFSACSSLSSLTCFPRITLWCQMAAGGVKPPAPMGAPPQRTGFGVPAQVRVTVRHALLARIRMRGVLTYAMYVCCAPFSLLPHQHLLPPPVVVWPRVDPLERPWAASPCLVWAGQPQHRRARQ